MSQAPSSNASPERQRTGDPPAARFATHRACPRCRAVEQTVVCGACGEFKFPRFVAPFAHELLEHERLAAGRVA
jgi:hypothetical protein